MEVKSMSKPRGAWCRNCTKKSCAIYDERPDDCRAFNCVWLKVETLPDELRPDKCGFVLTTTDRNDTVQVNIDPASTRLDHRLSATIQHFLSLGLRVVELRGDMVRHHPPLVQSRARSPTSSPPVEIQVQSV
jgi:hypothetical protein